VVTAIAVGVAVVAALGGGVDGLGVCPAGVWVAGLEQAATTSAVNAVTIEAAASRWCGEALPGTRRVTQGPLRRLVAAPRSLRRLVVDAVGIEEAR
jgi:hypothetical protein